MSLITITQSLGSGETGLADRVAAELKIELFDDAKLREKALSIGIHADDLASLEEKVPGFFDNFFSTSPASYRDFMESVVYEVARNGEGVIIGHGSQILLQDFGCALHIFLHASKTARVKNLMNQQGLTESLAKEMIRKNDNQKRGFLRYAYNLEWDDASLYDLVINTDKMGSRSTAQLIIDAARSEEINTCSLTALETMAKLSQVRKLRAELIKNRIDLSMLLLDVPQEGVVDVRGFTYSDEERRRLIEIVNADPSVSEVRSEVAVMQSFAE